MGIFQERYELLAGSAGVGLDFVTAIPLSRGGSQHVREVQIVYNGSAGDFAQAFRTDTIPSAAQRVASDVDTTSSSTFEFIGESWIDPIEKKIVIKKIEPRQNIAYDMQLRTEQLWVFLSLSGAGSARVTTLYDNK